MLNTANSALDNLLAKQEMHELMVAYCRALDRCDRALLRSVFHDDAYIDAGTFRGDPDGFVKSIIDFNLGVTRTCHRLSNEWYKVDGDHAIGESYLMGIASANFGGGDGGFDGLVGGRYLDRYTRRNGVWKISEHVIVLDWNINQPSTDIWDQGVFAEFKLIGGRGDADPVHDFWAGFPAHPGD